MPTGQSDLHLSLPPLGGQGGEVATDSGHGTIPAQFPMSGHEDAKTPSLGIAGTSEIVPAGAVTGGVVGIGIGNEHGFFYALDRSSSAHYVSATEFELERPMRSFSEEPSSRGQAQGQAESNFNDDGSQSVRSPESSHSIDTLSQSPTSSSTFSQSHRRSSSQDHYNHDLALNSDHDRLSHLVLDPRSTASVDTINTSPVASSSISNPGAHDNHTYSHGQDSNVAQFASRSGSSPNTIDSGPSSSRTPRYSFDHQSLLQDEGLTDDEPPSSISSSGSRTSSQSSTEILKTPPGSLDDQGPISAASSSTLGIRFPDHEELEDEDPARSRLVPPLQGPDQTVSNAKGKGKTCATLSPAPLKTSELDDPSPQRQSHHASSSVYDGIDGQVEADSSTSRQGPSNVKTAKNPEAVNWDTPDHPLISLVDRCRIPSRGIGCLRPGSLFRGSQTSGRSSYDVEVRIVDVNLALSTVSGYLSISHLTDSHPTLTTFFSGEIIGPRYGFLTGPKYYAQATEQDDMRHWSRFEHFRKVKNDLRKPDLTLRDTVPNIEQERTFVFMRWKERFLVPDHRVKDISGASFAGFYYIQLDCDPPPAPVGSFGSGRTSSVRVINGDSDSQTAGPTQSSASSERRRPSSTIVDQVDVPPARPSVGRRRTSSTTSVNIPRASFAQLPSPARSNSRRLSTTDGSKAKMVSTPVLTGYYFHQGNSSP